MTEEVEKLQQHLAAQSLQERFDEILHQSSGLKHFAKSQIDEQRFALSEMMTAWIKESVAPLGPQIETKMMEKFQLLGHGVDTQSGQFLRLLNEQNRQTQERALETGIGAASRANKESEAGSRATLSEDSVNEIRRELQEHEQRLGLTGD